MHSTIETLALSLFLTRFANNPDWARCNVSFTYFCWFFTLELDSIFCLCECDSTFELYKPNLILYNDCLNEFAIIVSLLSLSLSFQHTIKGLPRILNDKLLFTSSSSYIFNIFYIHIIASWPLHSSNLIDSTFNIELRTSNHIEITFKFLTLSQALITVFKVLRFERRKTKKYKIVCVFIETRKISIAIDLD